VSISKHDPGRITSVIGPNGAGKTTPAQSRQRISRPRISGTVSVDDREITDRPAHDVAPPMALRATFQTRAGRSAISVVLDKRPPRPS